MSEEVAADGADAPEAEVARLHVREGEEAMDGEAMGVDEVSRVVNRDGRDLEDRSDAARASLHR